MREQGKPCDFDTPDPTEIVGSVVFDNDNQVFLFVSDAGEELISSPDIGDIYQLRVAPCVKTNYGRKWSKK